MLQTHLRNAKACSLCFESQLSLFQPQQDHALGNKNNSTWTRDFHVWRFSFSLFFLSWLKNASPTPQKKIVSVDCYWVWAFYILHVSLIAQRQIQNILLWLFTYSVVAYEIGQTLKVTRKCYIFILLLLTECIVAFKCAFKIFLGKSLCLEIMFYFKVKQPEVLKVCVFRKQNKY